MAAARSAETDADRAEAAAAPMAALTAVLTVDASGTPRLLGLSNGAKLFLCSGTHPSQPNVAILQANTYKLQNISGSRMAMVINAESGSGVDINMPLKLGRAGTEGGELQFQNKTDENYDFVFDINAADQMRIRRGSKVFITMNPAGHIYFDRPIFADNAAAVTGGVPAGADYRTATGEVRVRV